MGNEGEIGAGGALARNPDPIGDDDVHRAALQGDGAGILAAELGYQQFNPFLAVEVVVFDDIKFPVDGAIGQHPCPDLHQLRVRLCDDEKANDERQLEQPGPLYKRCFHSFLLSLFFLFFDPKSGNYGVRVRLLQGSGPIKDVESLGF